MKILVCLSLVSLSLANYDTPSEAVNSCNIPHEVFNDCASHCEPTCNNPTPVCIQSCAPGACQCEIGYLRDENGYCVPDFDCNPAPAPLEHHTEEAEPAAPAEPEQAPEEPTASVEPEPEEPAAPVEQAPEEPAASEPTYNAYPAPAPEPTYNDCQTACSPPAPAAEASDNSYPTLAPVPWANEDHNYSQDPAPVSAPETTNYNPDPVPAPETTNDNYNPDPAPAPERTNYKTDLAPAPETTNDNYNSDPAPVPTVDEYAAETTTVSYDQETTTEYAYNDNRVEPQESQYPAENRDTAPEEQPTQKEEDEDTYIAGGSCSENTCRVGFRCADNNGNAKCIPFDTRARSSCAQVRCRPGWVCEISIIGPRCVRETAASSYATDPTAPTIAPYAAEAPSVPAEPSTSNDDSSYGAPVPVPERAEEPVRAKTCAELICPFGLTCYEGENNDGAFCRNSINGKDSPPELCSDVQCGAEETCQDATNGPVCEKNGLTLTCASLTCATGQTCVEHVEGAKCEEGSTSDGHLVMEDKTCADTPCPDMHQCFDSPEGATCYPIPAEPKSDDTPAQTEAEEPGTPSTCATTTCPSLQQCYETESGATCRPSRGGSSCSSLNCGNDEKCAIDWEGRPYCITAQAPSDPVPDHVPVCTEITCPDDHQCFDDSVRGAACWPDKKDSVDAVPADDANRSASPSNGYRHKH